MQKLKNTLLGALLALAICICTGGAVIAIIIVSRGLYTCILWSLTI